jgi:hypothetical protein
MIIGSGPIIIGQACEFDYSGTQACKALRKRMSKINKVLAFGSGPIITGQEAIAGRLADVGQPTRRIQPTRQIQPTQRAQPTRQMQPKRWILGENAWKLGVEG